jgi:hypothetical protein
MTGNVRRCSASAVLACGAAVAVAGIMGAPMARADGTSDLSSVDVLVPSLGAESAEVPPIVTAYPLDLLDDASKNLTDASAVLGPSPSDIPGLLLQTDAQGHALNVLTGLISAETSLDSYDSGAFADVLTPWFSAIDQGWDSATAAVLSADTAAENAFNAGSSVDAAALGVLSADFMLLGDMVNSLPIEFTAGLIDPSAFTDLVTSFGL